MDCSGTLFNLEADYQAQDFVTGTEGAQGDDVNNVRAGADYEIEAAPPTVAGQAPHYAHLLQSSGWAMTNDPVEGDTVFTPLALELPIPSCTMQHRNGVLMQNVAGVRGRRGAGLEPQIRIHRRQGGHLAASG